MTQIINYSFHTDLEKKRKKLESIVSKKVKIISTKFNAFISASINMDVTKKENFPVNVNTTVVLKTKLKDFVGKKSDKSPTVSLRKSFSAAEIQLKKHIDKISHKWENHSKNAKDK